MKALLAITVAMTISLSSSAFASDDQQQANDNKELSENARTPASTTVDDILLAELETQDEMTVQLKHK